MTTKREAQDVSRSELLRQRVRRAACDGSAADLCAHLALRRVWFVAWVARRAPARPTFAGRIS